MAKNTEWYKQESQKMLENIGTETPFEEKVLQMIYGFVCRLHREYTARKGGVA